MNPELDTHVTGRRVVATLVDGIVLSVLVRLVTWALGSEIDPGVDGFDLTALSTGGSLTALAVIVLYYVVLEGTLGRTVGKLVTGIRVVDEQGRRPGLVSALVRTVSRIVDSILGYLVALIIVVNSKRRRRLGDMLAKTYVVRA
ncbi:RDD family protein [Symbioplanes lichenis]|uniref:RDD family protein n=1 Tax=Symbioplanes lichenis TaxID=1629072 RepID=UPI0027394486|nr:RDD family protein [Actinoplanes lichenis]